MAKILVVSPTPSHPQDAGNRARIYSLLSGLKAAGHQVYFVFIKMEGGDETAMAGTWDGFFQVSYLRPENRWFKQKYDRWAKFLGSTKVLPYRIDDWYTPDIAKQLMKIREQVQPDVVLVEYIFLTKAFACFSPETLKLLDTHDIFGDRHRLFQKNGMTPQWFYTTVAEEKKALDRADAVIAIQVEESAYFKQLTQRKVITVGHLAQVPPPTPEEAITPERLLFIGSANPINIDALHWFIAAIFPLVRQQLPGTELEIVGGCAEKTPAANGLILTGRVVDLAPYYRQAKIVINPVRFGTGLKIKTIEALAHGRPLVTTMAGAAGLEDWKDKAFLVADSPEKFVEAINRIWLSPELSSRLTHESRCFISNYNNTILKPLEITINTLLKTS